ncbi:MAG: diacylglycerol kinase family protein [Patescibacteria group bacterium]
MPISRFIQSLRDAFNGIKYAFFNERNFRIQMLAACAVMAAAIYFPLQQYERLLITVMVFAVLMTELLNTAIEKLLDLLQPRLHHYAKIVKDVMAAAVLLISFCALIVGIIILLPHIVVFFAS